MATLDFTFVAHSNKKSYIRFLTIFAVLVLSYGCKKKTKMSEVTEQRPNVIFVLMDDMGYGQFGVHNDTLKTSDFDPYFVHLVDSLQHYSLEESLEFSKTAMPTVSKLAREGVYFTNAFTSSSLCAPSRMGIATGVLQNRFGVYRNTDAEKRGIDRGNHLATKMRDLGYKTAHIGKWHIGQFDDSMLKNALAKNGLSDTLTLPNIRKSHPEVYDELINGGYLGSTAEKHHPLNHGFDYFYGYNYWASQFYNATNVWENKVHAGIQEDYNTDTFTTKALNFIEKQVDDDEPFYVQLHYHAVHDSLEPKAPAKYFDRFSSNSYDLNNFYAHLYGVDENIKRVVAFLKSKNQYENTIIIFSSDNGAMAGGSYHGHKTGSPLPGNAPYSGHKGNYYQGGVRVPLFVHWPKGIKNPYHSKHLVSAMDIIPTALDAAGGEVPNDIDGKSLLPILRDENSLPIHEELYWAGIHSNRWGYTIVKTTKTHDNEAEFAPPAWAIVKGDYLLRFTGTLENGVYKDFLDGREPVFELFNLKNDPKEKNDLATLMPEVVFEMQKTYFKNTSDFKPPTRWDIKKWEELQKPSPDFDKLIFKD
ncbi:MAG: sulfatase-like hydrolase/transferase [Maribacter sp.]|uniref:sulfatase-like hydrolase/transferase n=1 Tax=Maribacter sp. TaxID=1897614 RepID=UPI003C73A9B9